MDAGYSWESKNGKIGSQGNATVRVNWDDTDWAQQIWSYVCWWDDDLS